MVDLEFTWQYQLSEFRPKQMKAVYENQVHLSLWDSMAIRVALISTSHTEYPRAQTPPTRRGSGDIRLIPRASLKIHSLLSA